jgi:chemotaxis protein methyltransferase CheR
MPIERLQSCFLQDAVWARSLAELVLPEQLERARMTRLFRVWSPACGTGEELYSVSLLLTEALPDADEWSIFLTGTDMDDVRLTRARRAAYTEGALRALSREERACYFRYNPNTRRYGLRERFVRNAHFGYRELSETRAPLPPPGRFDLILCPDAVAALSLDQQHAVLSHLGGALSERGVLVAKQPFETMEGYVTLFHAGLFAHQRAEACRPISSIPNSEAVPSSERPTVRPPSGSSDWSRNAPNELSVA